MPVRGFQSLLVGSFGLDLILELAMLMLTLMSMAMDDQLVLAARSLAIYRYGSETKCRETTPTSSSKDMPILRLIQLTVTVGGGQKFILEGA